MSDTTAKIIIGSGGLITNGAISITPGLVFGSIATPGEAIIANNNNLVIGTTANPLTSGQITATSIVKSGDGNMFMDAEQGTFNGNIILNRGGLFLRAVQAVSNVGGAASNNVSFKEALLELTVTPQITPDKAIIMDIKVTKNEVTGEVVQGQPVLAKREVSTQVLVRSGETVVLGGVYEQITSDSVDKIPFLGDIPGIGRLFRRNSTSNTKSELLIFITPQIVDGNVVIR